MAKSRRPIAAVTLAALMLASCGGGDGGTLGGGPVTVTATPSPTPTPTPACALASRQSFAKAVIDERYLFPGEVASVNTGRSEEHKYELQSILRISYAVL